MKVLIACEESQEVCKAFRAKGHEAYSCDIQMCSGGHPEWHILGDALTVINGNVDFTTCDGQTHTVDKWDLLIAHPPCTYLSNAGARHLWKGHKLQAERVTKGIRGRDLFMRFGGQKLIRYVLRTQCHRKCSGCPIIRKLFSHICLATHTLKRPAYG